MSRRYPVDPFWYAVLTRVRSDPGIGKSHLYANESGRAALDAIIASGAIEATEENGRIALRLTEAGERLLLLLDEPAEIYGTAREARGILATLDEVYEVRRDRLEARRRRKRGEVWDRCVLNLRL